METLTLKPLYFTTFESSLWFRITVHYVTSELLCLVFFCSFVLHKSENMLMLSKLMMFWEKNQAFPTVFCSSNI